MRPTRIFFSAGLLVAIAFASVATDIVGHPNPTAADQSLTQYMMRSTFGDNPETSVQCFTYFIPILNLVTQEFSKGFQLCATNEKAQIDALHELANKDRYQIELAADGVCVRIDACNDHMNSLDFFDCFAEQGKNNSRILYSITQNSSSIGSELREQYRIAEVDRLKCQNASERAYVEHTAITYKALDNCLQTGIVPTVDPGTTIATTVASSSSRDVEATTAAVVEKKPSTSSTEKEAEVKSSPLSPQAEAVENRNILSRFRKFLSNQ